MPVFDPDMFGAQDIDGVEAVTINVKPILNLLFLLEKNMKSSHEL